MAESNDKDPSIHKVISKRIKSTDGGHDKQDLDWKLAIPASYLYHNILKPSFPILLHATIHVLVDFVASSFFGFRSSLVAGGVAINAFPLPRSTIVVGTSFIIGSILYASDFSYSFEFGKSGNTILDKFISERRLKWIPYDKFTNVVYLDKGGFSTIYKAIWLYTNQNREVVLKHLNNLNENLDEFLNEWKCHQSCSNSYDIINLYGFTKSSDTLNYMVVMDYANKGNLRGNLTKVIKCNWKQKLNMLYKIISGLYEIHEQDLIHCDLHDGNILNHSNKNDEEEEENEADNNLVFVSDLGLCQPVKSSLKKGEVYGVIPFMAPEVLRGKSYTPASDIYSFSMIMWEFTSGVPPFNDRTHDLQLSLSICRGERPKIIENNPNCYMELMKKCWNEDPLKRPTASEVKYIIGNWIFQPIGSGINEEFENNKMEFINAQIGRNNLTTESHPQACYTSRLLNFTSEKLNEILESGDSQSYSSTGITEDLNDCIVEDMNN